MYRLVFPIVFAVLFIGWLLYRLLIKKDIKKQMNTVYLGLFFFAIWAILYFLIFHYFIK